MTDGGFGPPGDPVPADGGAAWPPPRPVPSAAPGLPAPAPGPPAGSTAVARRPGPAAAWQARPYQQLLRGPTYRRWRPLLSIAVLLLIAVAALFATAVGSALYYALRRDGPPPGEGDLDAWSATAVGLLVTNLVLAALIPATQLAMWAGFGWRPRWLSSVAGGLRWGWLLRCYAMAAVVLGGLTLAVVLLTDEGPWHPEHDWPVLALVVVTTTPLQAAGEEFLFRGWMQQTLGATFARPVAGALVGGAVSTTLFALAHGQQDPWLFGDRFAFGALACYLVWRTGGLEGGIALHGVNNLVAFAITLAQGGLAETLTATQSSPLNLLVDLVTLLPAVGVIVLLARRRRVVRLFTPPGLA